MAEKMRAIIKAGRTPGLEMVLRDIPRPGPREVLIEVKAMSICGTDLHIYAWDPWARERIRPPIIVGHEFCGTVVERGADVTEVEVGAYVSAESHITCGQCRQCRTGRRHLCQNTQIIGVDRDGCFAEYVVLPVENIWINPPDMPPELASLQENFGNAVHTAFATDVSARNVLITGCGPVGLMTIAVVRAAGARIIFATDISSYRLELARRMGADYALNVAEVDVVDFVRSHTDGEGVDVLLEMSGAAAAIDQGFRALADGGEAAILGLPSAPVPFDLANHVVFKGAIVYGIVGRRIWDTWYRIRGLLSSGAVDLAPIITHRFPMDQFEEAIRVMRSGQSGKIVLFPDTSDL
ncbi:MAG TPA: L-threonine 3-dehydrogenase [Caldilineae bacterium]|nr:L-threonine 3-dehydrogenase [Caldilineae bacterium]